jgi:hypothetical protein
LAVGALAEGASAEGASAGGALAGGASFSGAWAEGASFSGASAGATPEASGSSAAGLAVWQPQGTPLPGAATTADAPAMRPAITYRDTIAPGETRFYGIALDARSSAYASAFAVPPPGSRVAYGDGIELTLMSADGSRCDSQEAHFEDDGDARPVGTAVSRLIGADSSCQQANQYTLEVHRTSDGTSDPGAWPLELRYVSEPPLKAGADPGRAPATGTASPTPLTTGTAQQAHGGTDFETAAAVGTGIWKDTVLPGETRFYKVPVDWGQQATVFADFANSRVTGGTTYIGSGVRLGIYSPVREFVDGDAGAYTGTPTSLSEQLAPVAYANRSADEARVARVRYAGWYYLAVTVHPEVATAVSGALPVTLRIDITGQAQPGPAYDGDPGAAGIGVNSHTAAGIGGDSPSGPLRFLAFAALGAGTVLLLTMAGWYAVGRRRMGRATADAVPRRSGYGPNSW